MKHHEVRMETVTPVIARLWLEHRPYRGQRPLRQAHVKFLAGEMRRHAFRPTAEIVFAVQDNDIHYLINGQHTLHAIIESGLPQIVIVLCYQSEGDDDTAQTYGVLDTNLKRSTSDLFSAMQLADELNLTATDLRRLGSAVKLIDAKFSNLGGRNRREHNRDLVHGIRDYAPAAHQFFDALANLPFNMSAIYRAAVMAVGLVTFRYSAQSEGEQKVESFWRGVALDDSIANGDPRKAANRYITCVIPKGGECATAPYTVRFIAHCFNSYIENKTLARVCLKNANGPISIIGSPFEGRYNG